MVNIDEVLNINERICPMPQEWQKIWEMLPNKKKIGNGGEPSSPLILAAWWECTEEQKRERFLSHIKWAEEHNVLNAIINYLANLPEDKWFHKDD